jgi:hypothetical protein
MNKQHGLGLRRARLHDIHVVHAIGTVDTLGLPALGKLTLSHLPRIAAAVGAVGDRRKHEAARRHRCHAHGP